MPFPVLGALLGIGANLIGAGIAARRNAADQAAIGQVQQANTGVLDRFEKQYSKIFNPSIKTATRGADLYADALGINGAGGNERATGAFQTGPGYQFQMDQGLQALNRSASAAGMLPSGNTLLAATDYGQGVANQEYGNWLGRLSGYVPEQRMGLENKTALGSLVATGRLENNNARIEGLQSNVNNRRETIGGFLGNAGNIFGRMAGYKGYGS